MKMDKLNVAICAVLSQIMRTVMLTVIMIASYIHSGHS